jgi:hypothetical protein
MTETREREYAGTEPAWLKKRLGRHDRIRPECHGNLRGALTAAGLPEVAGED